MKRALTCAAVCIAAFGMSACAHDAATGQGGILAAGAQISPAYDPDNLIARTVRGDEGLPVLLESDRAIAVLIDRPASRGHFLVALKQSQARNFLELDDADTLAIMQLAQRVAAAEVKALGAQGFTLRQNNGSASSVQQYHLHVVPRWTGDAIPSGVGKPVEVASLEADALRIRDALER